VSEALRLLELFARGDGDPADVTTERFASVFAAIDRFDDCTDFDVLYLLNLWYAHRDRLPAGTREDIKARLLAFKYWYTEPTPPGVIDNRWYWSENHRIIFHVDEYLAGLAFPDETFTNDGRTGAEHATSARARILDWLEEKVRFGFSEWHSDVYYQKDVTPLLTLVEHAPDRELSRRAAMLLDVFLLDVALHLHRGNFGATHGRSYMKDKSTAIDQDTFGFAKVLFDDTTEPHPEGVDAGRILFACARSYTLPPVLLAIARDDAPMVDTEHMGVALDPSAPVVDDPVPPFGIAFDDPECVPFWWERGAQTAWQLVPNTIATLDRHRLWDSQFFRPFTTFRDEVGSDMDRARRLAHDLAPGLAFGLLSEVHTYTYRTTHVMLSTAQDYRPGVFGEQYHAWQATLDEHAVAFTTHPKNEPQRGTAWPDDDGYWTGTGSMPCSAQHRSVAVHIYAPQFEPFGAWRYLGYTHAYFPHERFDEVVKERNWIFGCRGEGYVALWSARPTAWRTYEDASIHTHGLTEPFDLVASGGPDNTWIVQVADVSHFDSFAAFRTAVTASPVRCDDAVSWVSPVEGAVEFSWSGPLRVRGEVVDLHPEARMHNPYVHIPFGGRHYDIRCGGERLVLDFDAWSRKYG
jgi:hypothetical protein